MALHRYFEQVFVRQHDTHMAAALSCLASWLKAGMPRAPAEQPRPEFCQINSSDKMNGDAQRAKLMYTGAFTWAGESVYATPLELFKPRRGGPAWTQELQGMTWLHDFAAEPKKLHAYYIVNLMAAWRANQLPLQDVTSEADRLANMTACLPRIADHLDPQQSATLATALSLQIQRLSRAKIKCTSDMVTKAIGILCAEYCLASVDAGFATAQKLLELGLDQIVLADGGPSQGSLAEHLVRIKKLWQLENLTTQRGYCLTPTCQHAMDRIASFVAMLMRRDGSLAFNNRSLLDLAAMPLTYRDTTAVALAQQSGFARLEHGPAVLIASNQNAPDSPSMDFSVGRVPMMCFGHFASLNSTAPAELNLQQTPMGSLLTLGWPEQTRQVFVAASGLDMRIEDTLPQSLSPSSLRIDIDRKIKMSLSRNGNCASLALPDRSHWQISVRGSKMMSDGDDHALLLNVGSGSATCVNWAVKKIQPEKLDRNSRSSKQQAGPSDMFL